MKKRNNLLPGLTLISQFGFTFVFGPLGLILSLPLAVIIQVLIKEATSENQQTYLFNFLYKYGYEKRIKKAKGCFENAKYKELKVK